MKRILIVASLAVGLAAAAPARANYVCTPVGTGYVCAVAEADASGGQVYTYGTDPTGNTFQAGTYVFDSPTALNGGVYGYGVAGGNTVFGSAGLYLDRTNNAPSAGAIAGTDDCYAYAAGYVGDPFGGAFAAYDCPRP